MANLKSKIHFWSQPDTIVHAVKLLQHERVILSSTDTVVGLLAPLTERGRALLDEVKARQGKPYLILTASLNRLEPFIEPVENLHIEKLIALCWPGPVTILFKAREAVPPCMQSAEGTIGVRIPDHAGLLQLLGSFNGLFSTSANIAGHAVPATIEDIEHEILDRVAYIIDDKPDGNIHQGAASTILDCSLGDIRVVRSGAYPITVLEKMAGIRFS